MKYQVLLKIKVKNIKVSSAAILLGALRVNILQETIVFLKLAYWCFYISTQIKTKHYLNYLFSLCKISFSNRHSE